MFIATLFLEGKPINQNKTQYLTMNLYELSTEKKVLFNNQSMFSSKNKDFTDGEIVWVNSVYNGRNFDKFYDIAKDKAYEKEYDKALLLCRYILSETPNHIDTKVLSGRVNIWQGNTEISIKILKSCIKTNPDYIDSYSALFDVYFWSGRSEEALALIEQVEQNGSGIEVIADKITRARQQGQKKSTATNTTKQKPEAELASADQ
jgi:tetratricopeptide (TPR) repeat protein